LELIQSGRPAVAMLDINLGDRNSFAVADALSELGVPFLFATGFGEQAVLPPAHQARPVIQKPYTLENVARALDTLLAADG
jgi:DNA-binding LytR/AlgR family response regulator